MGGGDAVDVDDGVEGLAGVELDLQLSNDGRVTVALARWLVVAGDELDPGRHWERTARDWIAWTRTPDHDAFWSYRAAFRAFVPPPGEATLEVGCGEGRIARELTDLGHRVTAVDLSPTLLAAARDAGSGRHHVRGDAEHLPIATGSFDRVVAYNVLMDVADMPAAVGEISRVLRPGGLVTISVVHPLADRGRFASREPDAPFVLEASWFDRREIDVIDERDGLRMHFAGWVHPLPHYVAALREAGLAVVDLAEPVPDDPSDPRLSGRWDRVPMFCWLTAIALP